MRAFIGIDLPKEVKDYLYDLEKELNKLPIKCKFVAKKNLHITIKFMKDLKENELNNIKEKLKEIKYPEFKVSLRSLDFFPKRNNAKVIWISLENENKLIELQQKIDSELLNLYNSNKQEFKSHITLGRIKLIKNKEKFNKLINNIKIKDIKFKIDSFQLFESTLTKDGPLYKMIKKYKLG